MLGTCTVCRIEYFRSVGAILKGKKLASHTRMIVNPGSREVYRQAISEGLIDILVEAGASIGVTGCGPCAGCHQGMLGATENGITTSSRNFRGRRGSPQVTLYVHSPAAVAASPLPRKQPTPSQ